jgi:long-chain acyl-CoA synthetase
MTVTFDEAVAAITAPGGSFSMHEEVIEGRPQWVFDRTPASLREVWATLRERDPDQVALVYEDERWTFREVADHIDALAALLADHYGVAPGDRVAIAMRNYPEWVTSFAAATSIGAIAVAMNAWWTTDELGYGLRDSGARVLIADDERVDRVVPLLGLDDGLDLHVVGVRLRGDAPPGPKGAEGVIDRMDDVLVPGAPLPDVEVAPGLDATILYTSGTTGEPKGAVSTHRAVLSALMAFACRSVVHAMVRGPVEAHPHPTCFILTVPLFHVTGLVPVMLGAVLGGNRLVMMYKWDPERALELIERERVTTFVGVPTMSWDLLESPDFARRDTSSLQSVGGGGAPAPPELVRRIDDGFARGRPSIGYGMTETNAYGPQNMGDDYVRKPRSAGRTVPVMRVIVTDPAGNEVSRGEVGEIRFTGPNLIRGYWNKPEATAETIVDGWLRTGDIGRMDGEGFVYVEDRAKDVVIRGGENIYCAEVEAAIYEHASVHEAAVFGIPHERLGEELAAAVHPKDGYVVVVEELQAFVGERLASFKVPTRVIVLDTRLPRGATGKILKRQLRDGIVGGP